MWSLNLDRVQGLLPSGISLPSLAIETGTCRGNGTRALAKRFSKVISIELSATLHLEAKARLKGPEFQHVDLHLGNSAALLPALLSGIPGKEPVLFFLDAHWSGDASVDWNGSRWKGYGTDTAHLGAAGRAPTGPEQCPLAEELRAIVGHCKGPAFVLIDDLKNLPPVGPGARDLEFKGEDWSHLSRELLLSIVAPRLESHHELHDPSQWFLQLKQRSLSFSSRENS